MQIKEAKIFNFGKLQNKTCHFAEGVNVIYGKNESGKSTLHTFLIGMLFGMEKSRGRASESDVYTKYEPWHAPSYYSGALRFEVDRKPFYLERNFYVKEKSEFLRNEEDGEELSVAYGDLQILLGGISKEIFGNTYDIPQTGAITGQAMTKLLSEYLQDAASGGVGIQVHKAIAEIVNRKKELNADLRKKRSEKETELQKKQLEQTILEQDCAELRRNLQSFSKLLQQEKKQAETGAAAQKQGEGTKLERIWFVSESIVIVILLLLKMAKMIPLEMLGVGAMVLILVNLYRKVVKNHQKQEQTEDVQEVQAAKEIYQKLQDTLWEKEIRLLQLKEEVEQAKMPDTAETELEENIAALELAASELERLSKEYYEEVEDELNSEVSRYVSLLTNGAYDSVRLSEKGTIRILTEGRDITPQSLSSGTLEQIYLALRLAVGAIVTKEEAMPIFLDDAFSMYDDERLAETLRVLAGLERQILIFSCQKREYRILEEMGIPYHKIQL